MEPSNGSSESNPIQTSSQAAAEELLGGMNENGHQIESNGGSGGGIQDESMDYRQDNDDQDEFVDVEDQLPTGSISRKGNSHGKGQDDSMTLDYQEEEEASNQLGLGESSISTLSSIPSSESSTPNHARSEGGRDLGIGPTNATSTEPPKKRTYKKRKTIAESLGFESPGLAFQKPQEGEGEGEVEAEMEVESETPIKRRPGRPKGSISRPPATYDPSQHPPRVTRRSLDSSAPPSSNPELNQNPSTNRSRINSHHSKSRSPEKDGVGTRSSSRTRRSQTPVSQSVEPERRGRGGRPRGRNSVASDDAADVSMDMAVDPRSESSSGIRNAETSRTEIGGIEVPEKRRPGRPKRTEIPTSTSLPASDPIETSNAEASGSNIGPEEATATNLLPEVSTSDQVPVPEKRRPGRPPRASLNTDASTSTTVGNGPEISSSTSPEKRKPGRPARNSINPDASISISETGAGPSNSNDMSAPVSEVPVPEKRRPGRPPRASIDPSTSISISEDGPSNSSSPEKRRGRLPRASINAEAIAETSIAESEFEDIDSSSPQRRTSGRPKAEIKYEDEVDGVERGEKRGPGRPRGSTMRGLGRGRERGRGRGRGGFGSRGGRPRGSGVGLRGGRPRGSGIGSRGGVGSRGGTASRGWPLTGPGSRAARGWPASGPGSRGGRGVRSRGGIGSRGERGSRGGLGLASASGLGFGFRNLIRRRGGPGSRGGRIKKVGLRGVGRGNGRGRGRELALARLGISGYSSGFEDEDGEEVEKEFQISKRSTRLARAASGGTSYRQLEERGTTQDVVFKPYNKPGPKPGSKNKPKDSIDSSIGQASTSASASTSQGPEIITPVKIRKKPGPKPKIKPLPLLPSPAQPSSQLSSAPSSSIQPQAFAPPPVVNRWTPREEPVLPQGLDAESLSRRRSERITETREELDELRTDYDFVLQEKWFMEENGGLKGWDPDVS